MEDQIKEKLLLVKEKFQRFSLYLAKQYVRTKRDIHRMLHPRDGSTWRGKKLHRWNMAELIDFFKNEVGVSNKALHRLEESEIDGAILDITLDSEDGDEALMETLKIDALTVRKLRRKLIEMDHDYEAEEHEEELLNFFKQIVVDNKGTTLVCVRVNRVCLDVPARATTRASTSTLKSWTCLLYTSDAADE